MGNRIRFGQRHIDKIFLTISDSLLNCANDITGFTDTNANLPPLITDNDNSSETKLFTTFNHLGDSADLNNALLPVGIFLSISCAFTTICCHVSLPLYARLGLDIVPTNSNYPSPP